MYNENMGDALKVNSEKHIDLSITEEWSSKMHVYNFFSVFLERQVLNVNHLDLSFMPYEYFEQIFSCNNSMEGKGYLNFLMILFTEHYQKSQTGITKIQLPEFKYEKMGAQFLLYCKCELLRREHKFETLKEENLFNPNVKTIFRVSCLDSIAHLKPELIESSIELQTLEYC